MLFEYKLFIFLFILFIYIDFFLHIVIYFIV